MKPLNQTSSAPVTAVVHRRIKPGYQSTFEASMRRFIDEILEQPGNLGVNVFRHPSDEGLYTIVDRFASEEDRREFTSSALYKQRMRDLMEVSEAAPEIQEIDGHALWLTLPASPAPMKPSRMKMAMVTLAGVYPLTVVVPALVAPFTTGWQPLLRQLLTATLIVAALTWLILPLFTRLLGKRLLRRDTGSHE